MKGKNKIFCSVVAVLMILIMLNPVVIGIQEEMQDPIVDMDSRIQRHIEPAQTNSPIHKTNYLDATSDAGSPLTNGGITLYVGGTGPGNYSTIQEAIDAANNSDMVFVFDDSSPYYENVVIDKSIDLIGEDMDTTIIDGGDINDVVLVSVDMVNISGFTIQNGTSYDGIEIQSDSNSVLGNNILNNSKGIHLYHSSNNVISDNTLSNNSICLRFVHSNNNNISGNNNYASSSGISIFYSHVNNISGNTISNTGFGIYFAHSSSNTILNSNISNNNNGIYLREATSNNNIISGNTISSNTFYGISLDGSTHSNIIKGNIIMNNSNGIKLGYSDNNIILENIINSNNNPGIFFHTSNNNDISLNTINGNNDGIIVYSSNGNTISENTISLNNDDGIYIYSSSSNNIVYHNNFIDNLQNAYDEGNNIWDDGYPNGGNYWSDYTGIDGNGDGIGDTPYNITGGSNQDNYPFMNQSGWNNNNPFIPSNPDPTFSSTGVDIDADLSWDGGDPDSDDLVWYDVYFSVDPSPLFVETIGPFPASETRITYDPGTLAYDTIYYWKIVAEDNYAASAESPVWSFFN